ncbi:MAG TPA: LamG-like jellyroll fold domain-containing protein [Sedimentisphaerales bacterium]|nr:LamG-like jellyroll fold domain-containing protein [Sedimentisphaerales bacterium]
MLTKNVTSISLLAFLCIAGGFSAGMDSSYFRYDSGEDWEKAARVAEHADIVVRPDTGGELVFWRGSSYLPYWKTDSGKWYLDELVARSGDGTDLRPDSICRFATARLIEDTPARAVVHWRYAPDFAKTDFDDFTDEYFTVYPDGRCVRVVKSGAEKLDDWRNPARWMIQELRLTADGIARDKSAAPPVLTLTGSSADAYNNEGIDKTTGSYVIKCRKNYSPSVLNFKLAEAGTRPVCNPSIVVKNWGDADVSVTVNGKSSENFKAGYINRAGSMDLVIWLGIDSVSEASVSITPKGGTSVANAAPVVNAGHDRTLDVSSDSAGPWSVRLSGSVDDDGLPADRLTISWSKLSGPGAVSFGNSDQPQTDAQFSAPGTYQLQLTANDGRLAGQDEVIVVVKKSPGVTRTPAVWWKFDDGSGDIAIESVSSVSDAIAGNKTLWAAGINGTALVADGYNTVVVHPASSAPAVGGALTLEAWIAVKAYPWNWCPIVHQSQFAKAGYFLGIDAHGHVGMKVHASGKWQEATSSSVVGRNKWVHVAGTFDKSRGRMLIYINGEEAGSVSVPDADITVAKEDIKIGKGIDMLVTDRIRENVGGIPDSYAFDGLIDDVKIYTTALTASQVMDSYNKNKPDPLQRDNPDLQKRVLPVGGSGKAHRFGAYYQTLKFYDNWDNMWRLGDDADVVIQFDQVPYKFVFWHGTSYIPNWVSEHNKWSNSEFLETAKGGIEGCGEPMSDKKCRHSHVHIIENNDARVVIHWRYGMVDVHDKFAYVDSYGWGDWGQEYHYIYPDGIAIRRQTLWSSAKNKWHEWHEAIVVNGPETRPEDNIEFDAVHLANIKAEKEIYSWENGLPTQLKGEDMPKPKDAHIHLVNLKSNWDHFSIFEQRQMYKEPECYDGELTEASRFPWWNHWPVSQVTSDGRWAYEPDRTSHSSFDNFKWRPTYETDLTATRLLLQGMTDKDILALVPLARAWENPPALNISSDGFTGGTFVRGERAYYLTRTSDVAAELKFTMAGSDDSPVVNPCFVIKGWDAKKLALKVDGKSIERGPDFRWAVEKDADGQSRLIIWIKMTALKSAIFEFSATG